MSKIKSMDINCIVDWELYHEMRGITNKLKTEEQLESDFKFEMEQRLILSFCYPESHGELNIVNGKRYNNDTLNFKENWDLLMYAVECIEGMGYFSTIEKFKEVDTHRMWFNECETFAEFGSGAREGTKKETIYEAVLDFCKTYVNKTKVK